MQVGTGRCVSQAIGRYTCVPTFILMCDIVQHQLFRLLWVSLNKRIHYTNY